MHYSSFLRVMKENNKINRRSRPRPFDLRRKVLLKNFLKEQKAKEQFPHIELSSTAENSDRTISEEPSKSLQIDDLQELNDENTSSPSVSAVESSSSTGDIVDNCLENGKNYESNINASNDSAVKTNFSDCPTKEPKYFKFASLMNLRSESKKKKVKGILKAKKVCKTVKSPVKSKPFKSGLNRLLRSRTGSCSSQDKATKGSSKSLFSLFKSRREQRKVKEDRTKSVDTKLNSKDDKYTSSQSVQTENSWCREELDRVQQSNMLLREENRLLAESLSYFMSSNSLDSQINHCSSPLLSSNRNSLRRSPGYDRELSSSAIHGYDYWHSRSRVLRSKSMQVHSERRDIYRNNCRTRSMNSYDVQNEHLHRPSTSATPSPFRSKVADFSIPRVRKKNILATLPVNSTVKVIQRRSSMPERRLFENDRSRMCRRSGSVVVSNTRTPFHSLPSEAFY